VTPSELTLAVREVIDATPRSKIIRLDLGAQQFPFTAGQAVLLRRHDGSRWVPYSLASSPEEVARAGWLELLVQAEPRLSDPGVVDELRPGTLLDVRGPIGHFLFPRAPEERRFLFVAGGTGIAPLRAMLWHLLLDTKRQSPDYIGLIYSARTQEEFAYAPELTMLAEEGRLDLRCTVTRAEIDHAWPGGRGRIDRQQLGEMITDEKTLCFVCGPPDLVRDVPLLLEELGVARARVRVEEWIG
jgi:ferredoxin-NADP reductase